MWYNSVFKGRADMAEKKTGKPSLDDIWIYLKKKLFGGDDAS